MGGGLFLNFRNQPPSPNLYRVVQDKGLKGSCAAEACFNCIIIFIIEESDSFRLR